MNGLCHTKRKNNFRWSRSIIIRIINKNYKCKNLKILIRIRINLICLNSNTKKIIINSNNNLYSNSNMIELINKSYLIRKTNKSWKCMNLKI